MSNQQTQRNSQPSPASASPTPAAPTQPPAPQPDIVDLFTNPAMIGTEKKSDTPTLNKAVQSQGNIEYR